MSKELAINKLTPIAEKYKPKQRPMWFEYLDKDGHRSSLEYEQGTYCEDCYKEVENILNTMDISELPDDFHRAIGVEETSREADGFTNCDSCGEIIECGILWTSYQEIEYWLWHNDFSREDLANNPRSCYLLLTILEGAYDEFPKQCDKISEKVLDHLKQQNEQKN
jgi:hypothetical protein